MSQSLIGTFSNKARDRNATNENANVKEFLYFFRIHNRVNKILGKSEFPEDVQAIKKRWKVGWRDAAPQRLVDSNTYGKFYLMINASDFSQ